MQSEWATALQGAGQTLEETTPGYNTPCNAKSSRSGNSRSRWTEGRRGGWCQRERRCPARSAQRQHRESEHCRRSLKCLEFVYQTLHGISQRLVFENESLWIVVSFLIYYSASSSARNEYGIARDPLTCTLPAHSAHSAWLPGQLWQHFAVSHRWADRRNRELAALKPRRQSRWMDICKRASMLLSIVIECHDISVQLLPNMLRSNA